MYSEVLPLGMLDLVRQRKYSCSQMNRIKIHTTSRERQCVGVGAWQRQRVSCRPGEDRKSNADEAGALAATVPLLLLKGSWTLALIRLLNDWTMFIYIIEDNLFYFV